MVFTPQTALKPENLPDHVTFRFAEVELSMVINTLTQLNQKLHGAKGSHELAVVQVLDMLTPNDHPLRDELGKVVFARNFPPSKTEVCHCLLYAGASIRETARIAGVATPTVQKNRDIYPTYHPVFKSWNTELIQKFMIIREFYNIHRLKTHYTAFPQYDMEPYNVAAFFKAEKQSKQQAKEADGMQTKHTVVDDDYDTTSTDVIIWD